MNKEDLFNNPMVENAMKQMSPEQLKSFRKLGEQMYNDTNFNMTKGLPPGSGDAVEYIEAGLRSGLDPMDLDRDEVILLQEYRGKKWYEKYGYKNDDIPYYDITKKNKSTTNK